MNPITKFYINDVEKVKYRNYAIDNDKNIKIFNTVYYILQKSIQRNLRCLFTGSIAAIFQFKKIYKTIKDIDLMIEKKDLIEWMNIINSIKQDCGSYVLYFSEETHFKAIENWNKQTKKDRPCLTFTNYCSGITIDLSHLDEDHLKKINIDDINIEYSPSEKFTGGKIFNRPTDIMDIKFFLQFEDAREYLLQFPQNKDIYERMV